jgi:hypothetical protein
MTVVAAVVLVTVHDSRFAALAPTAAVVGAAQLAAWAPGSLRPAAVALLAVSALAIAVTAPSAMHDQRNRYAALVPAGTGVAVRWLAAHSRPGDRVAIAPVDGAPTGWVVAGWADRPALVGADPEWLAFPRERADAAVATRVFTAASWPSEATFRRARAAHARWLYVPRGWNGVDAPALARAEARHPGLLAYRGAGALILRVPER